MRELARKLWLAGAHASAPNRPSLVNENLRHVLTQLTGAEGYASLLRRSVVLVGAEVPALRGAQLGANGDLEGVEQLLAHATLGREQAAIAITAQMLELLVTFIGEHLTRRLIREACPETSAND